jgi:hypothetical protein
MNRCDGCGRLLGLFNSETWCPCWRAVNRGATVPERLQARTRRYQKITRGDAR